MTEPAKVTPIPDAADVDDVGELLAVCELFALALRAAVATPATHSARRRLERMRERRGGKSAAEGFSV